MQIHQFNLQYLPTEDRLLFRLNTTEQQIISLMFTRRLVKGMVRSLDQTLEKMPATTLVKAVTTHTQDSRKASSQFEHENVVLKSDFKTPFEESSNTKPLGDKPLLLVAVEIKQINESNLLMTFIAHNKQSISLNMNPKILHSFYHLISQAAHLAEWDIHFGLASPLSNSGQTAHQGKFN